MRVGCIGVKLAAHSDQTIAMLLINETKSLQGYSLMLRNEKTKRITVDIVLDRLQGDGIDDEYKSRLHQHYLAFTDEYWNIVERGLPCVSETVQQLPLVALEFPRLQCSVFEKIRHLLAVVCAYWTLENALSNVVDSTEVDSKLLQPHAAQIIAVFRLLGVDSESDMGTTYAENIPDREGRTDINEYVGGLEKQLAQVYTGEGKSLILALLSVVLALLGCDIRCACYR